MEPFTAAPHHDVLVLLVQVAVLLFSARALGEVAMRLGQPSVVGEIMAGILLGPSLLSSLVPALGHWIVPETQLAGYLLEVVSLIGAMLLLLVTGLETDVPLIRQHARTAIGASVTGVLLPLGVGFAMAMVLPDSLLVDPEQRVIFSLFIATALSISAVPVIAKVLMDLDLMRRDVGQTILAAGVVGDAVGWMILSVVIGLAAGAAITAWSVFLAVGKLVVFAAATFTIGRMAVRWLLDFVQDDLTSRDRVLTLVLVLTFVWGAITQALGLEAVLGAFFLGMLFSLMPRLPKEIGHQIESITLGVFAPVFFAVAGLKVNLLNLLTPTLALVSLAVIAVATFGKVVGTYVGARWIGGRDHWTSLAMGAGMNARGAMEIIIATIGLGLGILSQDMFSIIVLMAMVTSLMAPPALRWALARVVPEEQEIERLKQEELASDSLIAQVRRVLLPVRRRPDGLAGVHHIEAHVVARLAARAPVSLTLLTATAEKNKAAGLKFLETVRLEFTAEEVAVKAVVTDEPPVAILEEAAKNYQLLMLGATEGPTVTDEALFSPVMDDLIRLAPCPTVIVHAGGHRPWPPRRILVPTSGTASARHAAEVAFAMASEPGEEVLVVTVAAPAEPAPAPASRFRFFSRLARPTPASTERTRELEARRQIAESLAERGRAQGAGARAILEVGTPEEVILAIAVREGVDLIVMGTDVKPGPDRLFLGPRVERILRDAPCPVIVVNAS